MAKAWVVAAPASGSGKTMITLGLLRALKNRGVRVASAKVGPDYIDPRFHQAASGQPCFNLDPWAMSPAMTNAPAFSKLVELTNWCGSEAFDTMVTGSAGALPPCIKA